MSVVDAAAAPSGDAEFQAGASQLAARTKSHVTEWGTLHLDGSKQAYRFAIVEPVKLCELPSVDLCDSSCCQGFFLIEAAAEKFWLVDFTDEGHGDFVEGGTRNDAATPPAKPEWETLDAVEFRIVVHPGSSQVALTFGLYHGVIVARELTTSSRNDDSHEKYVNKKGICDKKCPALATFAPGKKGKAAALMEAGTWSLGIGVVGPSAHIADLKEPAPPGAN